MEIINSSLYVLLNCTSHEAYLLPLIDFARFLFSLLFKNLSRRVLFSGNKCILCFYVIFSNILLIVWFNVYTSKQRINQQFFLISWVSENAFCSSKFTCVDNLVFSINIVRSRIIIIKVYTFGSTSYVQLSGT